MSDYYVDEKNPHLGGFKTGPTGDEATYYPDLWNWIVKTLGVKSVLDVGCGSGVAVNFFAELLGSDNVAGIDGVPQDNPLIATNDFTTHAFVPKEPIETDLVWCCEVVEHIEERFLSNLIETFKCGKMVMLTHAFPGQDGFHHVNCREPAYWVGVMAAISFRLDPLLTAQARAQAAFNQSPWNHFTRSGMVFVRN